VNKARAIVAIALTTIAVVSGCVRGYTVKVTNLLDTSVVIEFSQYHAEDFGRAQPQVFTSDLHVGTRQVTIGAGDKTEVVFNDAIGGFWVTWRQIEPEVVEPISRVLDLTRDSLKIRIESIASDDV
jgi:hypothetical protein